MIILMEDRIYLMFQRKFKLPLSLRLIVNMKIIAISKFRLILRLITHKIEEQKHLQCIKNS